MHTTKLMREKLWETPDNVREIHRSRAQAALRPIPAVITHSSEMAGSRAAARQKTQTVVVSPTSSRSIDRRQPGEQADVLSCSRRNLLSSVGITLSLLRPKPILAQRLQEPGRMVTNSLKPDSDWKSAIGQALLQGVTLLPPAGATGFVVYILSQINAIGAISARQESGQKLMILRFDNSDKKLEKLEQAVQESKNRRSWFS